MTLKPDRTEAGLADGYSEIPDDPRLVSIAEEFLARLRAGEKPTLEEYIAKYPELAAPLKTCLAGLEVVHGLVREGHAIVQELPTPRGEHQPKVLGDFQIVCEVGAGGMGVVYEAIQISLRRRVALKVLSFAATLQQRQLQRFLNEAQAAAHLHHPHIVPVFAVGSERGVYYYAMQFIDGVSLAELLAQLRASQGIPDVVVAHKSAHRPDCPEAVDDPMSTPSTRPLSETIQKLSQEISTLTSRDPNGFFRTVAEWIRQAAQALAHAHELGIVHRDIKPANLMLDGNSHIWVTDFGLAQIRSGNDLTQTGDLLGTLRYMSPEQAAGDRQAIDHRTDIYSLGATLYELLTLRPVYAGRNRETLLHEVAVGEPRPPRAINAGIPVELETITLKAISAVPQDRYASAQDFSDDLGRFLEDKPILARRPSPSDRVLRWARRHPIWIATGVVALLLQSVAIAVHDRMIAVEQGRTAAALDREQQRTAEAEQRLDQLHRAVDVLIDTSEEEIADDPQFFATRKRLLETAVGFYDDLLEQDDGSRAVRSHLTADRERAKGMLRSLATLQSHLQLLVLANPSVQADLQLSDTQRPTLAAFIAEVSHADARLFKELGRASREARDRRFLETAIENGTKLQSILTSEQQNRLRQIVLQVQGLAAFQEPEIVKTLALSRSQRRQVHDIELDARIRLGPRQSPFAPMEDRAGLEIPRDVQGMDAALALLSPEQVAKWRELIGRPFQGRVSLRPLFWPPQK
jgi:hypothetical protein